MDRDSKRKMADFLSSPALQIYLSAAIERVLRGRQFITMTSITEFKVKIVYLWIINLQQGSSRISEINR